LVWWGGGGGGVEALDPSRCQIDGHHRKMTGRFFAHTSFPVLSGEGATQVAGTPRSQSSCVSSQNHARALARVKREGSRSITGRLASLDAAGGAVGFGVAQPRRGPAEFRRRRIRRPVRRASSYKPCLRTPVPPDRAVAAHAVGRATGRCVPDQLSGAIFRTIDQKHFSRPAPSGQGSAHMAADRRR